MKKKYKILFAFICILTLFCFNVPTSAVTDDYTLVYTPWRLLATQEQFTDLPQLFYRNWNTGNFVWFQGNESTGILSGQSQKVLTWYKPAFDSTTGLWNDSEPGMTYNAPDAYIERIDASVIGLNMPYNFGDPMWVTPPAGGHVTYKVNILFRWDTLPEYSDGSGTLIFNNVSVFAYTKADRTSNVPFDFVDFTWTSGDVSKNQKFYQRIYEFEYIAPLSMQQPIYGFMIKFEGHFAGNDVANFTIGISDVMYSKITYAFTGAGEADSDLSSITDDVNDLVYSEISPLTNGIYFNKIVTGSKLANAIINRFANLPWLNYMLIFSLAVGVVGFLFSFTGKVHR